MDEIDYENDKFIFNSNPRSCDDANNGKCCLDGLSKDQIEAYLYRGRTMRSCDPEYCLNMASWLVSGEYMPKEGSPCDIRIKRCLKCKNLYITDGRHRICVISKLTKLGMSISYPVEEQYIDECGNCSEYPIYNSVDVPKPTFPGPAFTKDSIECRIKRKRFQKRILKYSLLSIAALVCILLVLWKL